MQNQKCDQNKRDFFSFRSSMLKIRRNQIKSNQILYVISMMLGSTFSGFKNRGCLLDCGVGFSGSRFFFVLVHKSKFEQMYEKADCACWLMRPQPRRGQRRPRPQRVRRPSRHPQIFPFCRRPRRRRL